MRMTEENIAANSEITMDDVKILIKKKDEIEEQIKAYYDVLEDQGVGVEGPLVDAEGFPRADVNLYQIRTARHNISCLQNDHKSIMTEIEEALHKLHAREKAKREHHDAEMQQGAMEKQVSLPSPFARVDAVTHGSPASGAKPLRVTVLREGQKTQMSLTPQQWSGRGLLGCNIVPIHR
ncbi:26S proteasome non-ATPase regulatory subunit 9 isoform X2 [Channa argus]|uniref:26S proteasome non-ATPase regulatory subunit 9 isoform X2 n=1 Tax=Channa argus TaxID=215402 RepID=UPI0035226255